MKGFLEEYGKIILVVCVILLMLTFSKTGLAKQMGDSIVAVVNDLHTTSESYVLPAQDIMYIDVNGVVNNEIIAHMEPDVITFDVYINGKQESNNYSDFWRRYPQGSTIKINDFNVNSQYKLFGYSINTCAKDKIIPLNTTDEINLTSFTNNEDTKIYLHLETK